MPSPYISDPTDPNLLQFMQSLIAAQQQGGGGGGGSYPISQAATNVEVDPVIMAQRMGRVTGAQNERAARLQQRRELELLEARANIEAQNRAQEQSFAATQADLDRQARAGELATRITADERTAKMNFAAQNAAAAKLQEANYRLRLADLKAAMATGSEREAALKEQREAELKLQRVRDDVTAANAEVEKAKDPTLKELRARLQGLKDQTDVHASSKKAALSTFPDTLGLFVNEQLKSTTSGMGEFSPSAVEGLGYGIGLLVEGLSEATLGLDKTNDMQLKLAGNNLDAGVLSAYSRSQPETASNRNIGGFFGFGEETIAGAANDPDGVKARKWASNFLSNLGLRALGASGQRVNVADAGEDFRALINEVVSATQNPDLMQNPDKLTERILPRIDALAEKAYGPSSGTRDYRPIIVDIVRDMLAEASTGLRKTGTDMVSAQQGQLNLQAIQGGALMTVGDYANQARHVFDAAIRGKLGTYDQYIEAVGSLEKALAPVNQGGYGGEVGVLRELIGSPRMQSVLQHSGGDPAELLAAVENLAKLSERVKTGQAQATELEKAKARLADRFANLDQPRLEAKTAAAAAAEIEKLLREAVADREAAESQMPK